jgi:hypothetical protein
MKKQFIRGIIWKKQSTPIAWEKSQKNERIGSPDQQLNGFKHLNK